MPIWSQQAALSLIQISCFTILIRTQYYFFLSATKKFQYFLCFSEETEIRLILIGSRWAGKSSSGNTILRKERFECGRTRTAQSEVRHGLVDGRKLTVIDAPGWSSSLSLAEIPEGDKQVSAWTKCFSPRYSNRLGFLCGAEDDCGGTHEALR